MTRIIAYSFLGASWAAIVSGVAVVVFKALSHAVRAGFLVLS